MLSPLPVVLAIVGVMCLQVSATTSVQKKYSFTPASNIVHGISSPVYAWGKHTGIVCINEAVGNGSPGAIKCKSVNDTATSSTDATVVASAGAIQTLTAASLSDEQFLVCHQKMTACEADMKFGRKVSGTHDSCPCPLDKHWYSGGREINDIALSQPTSQIGTSSSGASSRAVDGTTSSTFAASSCTHTTAVADPWWNVDLQTIQPIDKVTVYNRADGVGSRLSGFEVYISNSTSNWKRDANRCAGGAHLNSASKNTCDEGSSASQADCLAAARRLLPPSATQGRRTLVVTSHPSLPPGCSVQSSGDWAAHYNTNTNGNNGGGYQLVCGRWGLQDGSTSDVSCGGKLGQYVHVAIPTTGAPRWKLLFRQTQGTYKPPADWKSFSTADPTSPNYSILDTLTDADKHAGKFTFKLVWPQKAGSNTQEWKQTSNPMSKISGSVDGYEAINAPFNDNSWGGLEYNGVSTLLDGSVGASWQCSAYPTNTGTNQQMCENGNTLNDGKMYLYNAGRLDPAIANMCGECWCCYRDSKAYYAIGSSATEIAGPTSAEQVAELYVLTSTENVYETGVTGVGNHGGSCTCPDGSVYQVGDSNDSCGSLQCFGGTPGVCNSRSGIWSGNRKVTCAPGRILSLCEVKVKVVPSALPPEGFCGSATGSDIWSAGWVHGRLPSPSRDVKRILHYVNSCNVCGIKFCGCNDWWCTNYERNEANLDTKYDQVGTDFHLNCGMAMSAVAKDSGTGKIYVVEVQNQGRGVKDWCAPDTSSDEWMQFDLGSLKSIEGILTKGRSLYAAGQWVKSYKVKISNDGNSWTAVPNGESATWTGNTDANSPKTNTFSTPVAARYLRVYPLTSEKHPSMRANLVCSTDSNLYCNNIQVDGSSHAITVGPAVDVSATAGDFGQQYVGREHPQLPPSIAADVTGFDSEHGLLCGRGKTYDPPGPAPPPPPIVRGVCAVLKRSGQTITKGPSLYITDGLNSLDALVVTQNTATAATVCYSHSTLTTNQKKTLSCTVVERQGTQLSRGPLQLIEQHSDTNGFVLPGIGGGIRGALSFVAPNTLMAVKIKGKHSYAVRLSSYDCGGNDVNHGIKFHGYTTGLATADECRNRCALTSGCNYYVFWSDGRCYTKSQCSSFSSTSHLGSGGGAYAMVSTTYEDLKAYTIAVENTLLIEGEAVTIKGKAGSNVNGYEATELGTGITFSSTDSAGNKALACFSDPGQSHQLTCTTITLNDAIIDAHKLKTIVQGTQGVVHVDTAVPSTLRHRNLHSMPLRHGVILVCYNAWQNSNTDSTCSVVMSLPEIELITVPFMELGAPLTTCPDNAPCESMTQPTFTAVISPKVAEYGNGTFGLQYDPVSGNAHCNALDTTTWIMSNGYADTNGAGSVAACKSRCTQDHRCVAFSYFTPTTTPQHPTGAENYRCYLAVTCNTLTNQMPASWTAKTWIKFAPVDFWREPGSTQCSPTTQQRTYAAGGSGSIQACAHECRKQACVAFTYFLAQSDATKCNLYSSGGCKTTAFLSNAVTYRRKPFLCNDGQTVTTGVDSCSDHGSLKLCPVGLTMCNKKCAGGEEYCCKTSCTNDWGDKVDYVLQPLMKVYNPGGPIMRYQYATNLPSGVKFDSNSGTFYGTPSAATNLSTYFVNVSGADGITFKAQTNALVRDLSFASLVSKYTFNYDDKTVCESDPSTGRSASSTHTAVSVEAGMLSNEGNAWTPDPSQAGEVYYQIDAGTERYIAGVITLGNANAQQWVTSYTIETSTDGTAWTQSNGPSGSTWAGNTDSSTPAVSEFSSPVSARFVRVKPKGSSGLLSMRVGLLCNVMHPKDSGRSSSDSLTLANTQSAQQVKFVEGINGRAAYLHNTDVPSGSDDERLFMPAKDFASLTVTMWMKCNNIRPKTTRSTEFLVSFEKKVNDEYLPVIGNCMGKDLQITSFNPMNPVTGCSAQSNNGLRTGNCQQTEWKMSLPKASGLVKVIVGSDEDASRDVNDRMEFYVDGVLKLTKRNTGCHPTKCEDYIAIKNTDTELKVKAVSSTSDMYKHMSMTGIEFWCGCPQRWVAKPKKELTTTSLGQLDENNNLLGGHADPYTYEGAKKKCAEPSVNCTAIVCTDAALMGSSPPCRIYGPGNPSLKDSETTTTYVREEVCSAHNWNDPAYGLLQPDGASGCKLSYAQANSEYGFQTRRSWDISLAEEWHFVALSISPNSNAEFIDNLYYPGLSSVNNTMLNTYDFHRVNFLSHRDELGAVGSLSEAAIDDLRLYNRSLSEKQIRQVYCKDIHPGWMTKRSRRAPGRWAKITRSFSSGYPAGYTGGSSYTLADAKQECDAFSGCKAVTCQTETTGCSLRGNEQVTYSSSKPSETTYVHPFFEDDGTVCGCWMTGVCEDMTPHPDKVSPQWNQAATNKTTEISMTFTHPVKPGSGWIMLSPSWWIPTSTPLDCNFDANTCKWYQSTSTTVLDCSFESQVCVYNAAKHSDNADWTRHSGGTSTSNTGPSGDHTTGSGHYLYHEVSVGSSGHKASLLSPGFLLQASCSLEFYYHMYGSSTGTLSVEVDVGAGFQTAWSISGNVGNQWVHQKVHIGKFATIDGVPALARIVSTRGANMLGDIAIDDVSMLCKDVVIDVTNTSQVSISGNVVTIDPEHDLNAGNPLNEYTVSYPSGTFLSTRNQAVPACCTREYVHSHEQIANSATAGSKAYFGQVSLPQNFKLSFDLTITHQIANEMVHIFSIGDAGRKGPAISYHGGKTSLYVRVDTETTTNKGGQYIGVPMTLNVAYHFEITYTGKVFTIKKNDATVFTSDLGAAKKKVENEPLYVGGTSSSSFVLEHLRIYDSAYSFTVVDSKIPVLVSTTPSAGGGNSTHPVLPSTDISMTFDRSVRKGTGIIVIEPKEGPKINIDVLDSQISISGPTVTVNPSNKIPEVLETAISLGDAVIFSSGSWAILLENYAATTKTPLSVAEAPFNGNNCGTGYVGTNGIASCHSKCVEKQCAAFQHFSAGGNAGKCCLFSQYALGGVNGVTATPDSTFNAPNPGDSGVAYGGIKPPDKLIKSALTLEGLDLATWQADPNISVAVRKTFANLSSTDSFVVTQDMVNATPITDTTSTSRRLLSGSLDVNIVITVPGAQASQATGAAAQLGSNINNVTQTLQTQAQALGVDTSGIQATAAAPSVQNAPSQFSFTVTDATGPTVTSFSPAQGAVVAPTTSIMLTFSEGIQAGTGYVRIQNDPADDDQYFLEPEFNIDIRDASSVQIIGNTLTVIPRHTFRQGTVTVSLANGVVTDDPHVGTANPNPSPGVAGGVYSFTVGPNQPATQMGKLQIGMGSGSGVKCGYVLTGYNCPHFEECLVFVRPVGHECKDSGPENQVRYISYHSLQRIAQHGFAANGADGVGTVLTYGSGERWPDFGVVDLG